MKYSGEGSKLLKRLQKELLKAYIIYVQQERKRINQRIGKLSNVYIALIVHRNSIADIITHYYSSYDLTIYFLKRYDIGEI